MPPRYTVRVWRGLVVVDESGTEEPEQMTAYYRRVFPGLTVTVTDEYAEAEAKERRKPCPT